MRLITKHKQEDIKEFYLKRKQQMYSYLCLGTQVLCNTDLAFLSKTDSNG